MATAEAFVHSSLGSVFSSSCCCCQDATPGQPKLVKAFIEGPFGSPSIDLYGDRYKAFLLLSGGIGVTPVQSFFNHLMAQRARGRPVKLAHLVWSVRDRALVSNVLG